MTTLHLKKSIGPATAGRAFFLIPLALTFALSLTARAVDPPPDGGYPGNNTAEGDNALFSNTTGYYNTATGYQALYSNTTGAANVANGTEALFHNTGGNENTATGSGALFYNTTGNNNSANGLAALQNNTTGMNNTANGHTALVGNTGGSNHTANGFQALGSFGAHTGSGNTATGVSALFANTTGGQNTATGLNALLRNKTGNGNTAEGEGTLENNAGSFNIAVGFNAGGALTTGSNNIDIGNVGVKGESNTMRIGTVKQKATFITGIRGTATANANAVPVVIDSAGQLGTVSSSRRFKDEIKPMDSSSEAILGLKPVTFHYKTDKQNTPQFGLIAEEVAKVNPDLVVRDGNGEIYTVRYDAVNAMLLNEFLKEHRNVAEQQSKIAQQQSTIAELKTTVAEQQKQIEALTATVQKVNDQIALSKPAPHLVANP